MSADGMKAVVSFTMDEQEDGNAVMLDAVPYNDVLTLEPTTDDDDKPDGVSLKTKWVNIWLNRDALQHVVEQLTDIMGEVQAAKLRAEGNAHMAHAAELLRFKQERAQKSGLEYAMEKLSVADKPA